MLLFKNTRTANGGQRRFERIAAAPNSGLAVSINARGMAIADFDQDGKLDVVTANAGATPTILRNVSVAKNNWLKIKLVGDVAKKTPKDAIGSTVFVTTGKLRQRFDLTSGANYASQDEQTIHVGLGDTPKIDKLEVVWANGQTEIFPVDGINRLLVIKQTVK
jgi:hypothetical protein